MRTAYEIVRRIAETAMSRHGLDARKLAGQLIEEEQRLSRDLQSYL